MGSILALLPVTFSLTPLAKQHQKQSTGLNIVWFRTHIIYYFTKFGFETILFRHIHTKTSLKVKKANTFFFLLMKV